MKARYASMPDWVYRWLKITDAMDKGPFRQHDHDYGTAGYTRKGWPRADTRAEADRSLRLRLIESGMKPWRAWLIWWGCVTLIWWKWRRG